MTIELDKEQRDRAIASIQRYFEENMMPRGIPDRPTAETGDHDGETA